jgi:FAD/FMN-containing dehydrogenase
MTPTSGSPDQVVDALRGTIEGDLIAPGDPGYDQARRVWNGVIDRRPAAIALCSSTGDVVAAVHVAREHDIDVAIRGGGHQVAGSAVCDDGLVIDLSPMSAVSVDPSNRTATVGGGARWADVDQATLEHGLATTGGEVSTTGVGGFTLGGGMGLLHRAFGLACDNLHAIELVTADGVVRRASADEHPDLFWAARGAGRGIGIVTSFEFGLRPLGPDVAVAEVHYRMDEAASVVRGFRDLAVNAPETISPELIFWSVPPDPEIPEELHGEPVVVVLCVYAGDPKDAAPVLEPFAELGTPLLDLSGTVPYVDQQAAVDALFPDGDRYYFKSQFADELTDDVLDVIERSGRARPTPGSLIAVRTLGGAIDRVSTEQSAYPHRGAGYNISFDGAWSDPADDREVIGWARDSFTSLAPHATGGVYVNFAGFDDEQDVSTADTLGNEARLAEIRATYDPEGVFSGPARRR